MSVESTLHPARATKKELKTFLEGRGYTPTKHLWKWPRGSLHYSWFNPVDNLSFDGVEATIFRPSSDAHKLGACDWALHTRTRSSGSRADKVEQNSLIREAKARFGGNFYNDWGGRNRHSQEPTEYRDAAARGVYLAYEVVSQHLQAVGFSIPPENEGFARMPKGWEALARNDPVRVLYNALLPFAVASLEGFFSRVFVIMIRYDPAARKHLGAQTRKIEFEDALAISRGERTIEDVVGAWFSFQNLNSLQKAFSDWLGLDFRKVLRDALPNEAGHDPLDEVLDALIRRRHLIVHELDLDFDLRRSDVVDAMANAGAIIDAFVDYLEGQRGMVIRDETILKLADGEAD